MRVALLALMLALPARADDAPRVVLEVRDGVFYDREGQAHAVAGGAWLDGSTLLASGKELASLRAENVALREAPATAPSSVLVAVAVVFVAGLAGGFALGWAVRR